MLAGHAGRDERRVAFVVGLGLIGTSLALALRKAGWTVYGTDVDAGRAARAVELGAIEGPAALEPAEAGAAVAFVATPVRAIAGVARDLLERDATGTLVVSDVGGVKGEVVRRVDHPRFVGGHPMAGSEQEGPDGADGDLFAGATWVLTPTARTDARAFGLVREAVAAIGAEPVALDPARHDRLVALVSHVPHLAAANLMDLAADAAVEHGVLLRLAAGGFRDMTRIAAGDPAIWPDIFAENAPAVLAALDGLAGRLAEARRIVAEGDWPALVALLERAKVARRNLPPRAPVPDALVECRVPVLDRPGVLAEVTTVLGGLGVNIFDLEIAHSAEGERGVLVMAIDAGQADEARRALVERGYRPALRALR
ncbi:MAG TPA: prephenate dehydrogenase [Acidimicrobiales bacterium]|nr:prephenate dehydrogenase [Acidimicrobiales bacterium]